MKDYIKLPSDFQHWKYYDNTEMVRLFLHIILVAKRSRCIENGVVIDKGQALISRRSICRELGISEGNYRTLIKKLIHDGYCSIRSNNHYSLITVNRYDNYLERPTNDPQMTHATDYKSENYGTLRPTNDPQTTHATENDPQMTHATDYKSENYGTLRPTNDPQTVLRKAKEEIKKEENSPHTPYKEERNQEESRKEKKPVKTKAELIADMERRKKVFYSSLIPYLLTYGKEMLREFFDYWSEPNKSQTKMRFEQQTTWALNLRLARWANNNNKYSKSNGAYQQNNGRAEREAAVETRIREILSDDACEPSEAERRANAIIEASLHRKEIRQ